MCHELYVDKGFCAKVDRHSSFYFLIQLCLEFHLCPDAMPAFYFMGSHSLFIRLYKFLQNSKVGHFSVFGSLLSSLFAVDL